MHILIADAQTANPGDLSWSAFEELGTVSIFPRSSNAALIERAATADAILTNKVAFDAATIQALPELKYIGVTATGYNIIDLNAARDRGIAVCNVPGYSSDSVAQTVFAHLLELTHNIALHARAVSDGKWSSCPDFCFWEKPIIELSGLTIGLIGFGDIAQAVARIARAFGMRVLVHTRTVRELEHIQFVDRETLFKEADVVSLHCPLTDDTKGMINADSLHMMKDSAFLINTGRGPLIDEVALAEALNKGVIAGAGLDVLSSEPPEADHPLFKAANCFISPHIAWASRAARGRLIDESVENLKAFIAGEKRNRVD